MIRKCIVLGAGGHGVVVAGALLAAGVDVLGFLDNDMTRRSFAYRNLRVLGGDDLMASFARETDVAFVCGVGGARSNELRRDVFLRAVAAGLLPLTVVHPAAHLDADASIGAGSFVGVGAIVNAGCEIGVNTIVNSGAIVEHHCKVGDHVHVATGAVLCGAVEIGDEAHVGAGATVRQGLRVGRGSVIGAGSVVVAEVGAGEMVVGNPARPWAAADSRKEESRG